MPAKYKQRAGMKGVYIEAPPEVVEAMKALAERNGRDFREEAIHAWQRHLAAPPVVRIVVEEPAMPESCAESPAPSKEQRAAKRPRGRPLK